MKRLFVGSTLMAAGLLAAAVFASFAFTSHGGRFEPAADASAFCNSGSIAFDVEGSTTVGEIVQPHETDFESEWGPDLQLTLNGSGAGIASLTAGTADAANSSRALTAGEIVGKYAFSIAFDEFVIVVSNDAQMNGLNDITVSQLSQIWGAGAGITSLEWDALSPAITFSPGRPTAKPIPRMRITASGSRGDFNGQISVSNTTENNTYTALGGDGGPYPRNTTALQQAQSVAGSAGVDQIAYTSLKDGIDAPPAGIRALTVNGITPSQASVFTGYPLPRELFIASRDLSLDPRVDNSEMVRVDDYINFWRGWDRDGSGLDGIDYIAAEGMVPRPQGAAPPIPDWDVTMTSGTGLGDIGAIIQKWGLDTACNGWIRADANNNSDIGLTDIGIVINHWGQPGFTCVSGAVCPNNP